MVKRTTAKQAKPNNDRWMKMLATIFSILLVALGVTTLILIQRPIRESQDLRRAASIEDGLVTVSSTNAIGAVGESSRITLNVNTNSAQTHGVQLIFKVVTDTFGDLNVSLADGLGLQVGYQEVETVSDGFLVGIIAIPSPGQPFATNVDTPFINLDFTPTLAGDITLEFDPDQSISILFESDPPEDQLKTIASQSFTVEDGSSDDGGDDDGGGDDGGGDDGGGDDGGGDDGGGDDGGDDDGGGDGTGTGGVPAEKTCNEYCADSRECVSGLTCYNNSCRKPDNPDSSSCSEPSDTTTNNIQKKCNESCSSNSDCGANLRCYQSVCRLATNPSSASCSTATTSTVSTIYVTETVYVTPSPKTSTKGGTTIMASSSPAATSAATTKEIPIIKFPTPSPEGIADYAPEPEDKGLLENLLGLGSNFALLLIGGGLFLLILILLWIFLGKNKDKNNPPKPPAYSPTPQTAEKMDNLQQKIDSMQNQPPASGINKMPPTPNVIGSNMAMPENSTVTPTAPKPTLGSVTSTTPAPTIGNHLDNKQPTPSLNGSIGSSSNSPKTPPPTFGSHMTNNGNSTSTPIPNIQSSGGTMANRLKKKGIDLPNAPKTG